MKFLLLLALALPVSGQQYRSSKPLTVANPDGTRTVSVMVTHVAKGWANVPSTLMVTYAPDGKVQSLQINANPHGRKVSVGPISRPESNSEAEMKTALFTAFEAQATAAAEGKELRKRDLLNRIAGGEQVDVPALSAGLRHNLDLILGHPPAAAK